jgi:hypothetical protein
MQGLAGCTLERSMQVQFAIQCGKDKSVKVTIPGDLIILVVLMLVR